MNKLLLIFFMMVVTYLPRVIPSILCDKLKFGKKFKKFLELIPYAAMTALIFPGVLSADPNNWIIGAVGAVVAVLLALVKKIPIALIVVAAVLADMAMYLIV